MVEERRDPGEAKIRYFNAARSHIIAVKTRYHIASVLEGGRWGGRRGNASPQGNVGTGVDAQSGRTPNHVVYKQQRYVFRWRKSWKLPFASVIKVYGILSDDKLNFH